MGQFSIFGLISLTSLRCEEMLIGIEGLPETRGVGHKVTLHGDSYSSNIVILDHVTKRHLQTTLVPMLPYNFQGTPMH